MSKFWKYTRKYILAKTLMKIIDRLNPLKIFRGYWKRQVTWNALMTYWFPLSIPIKIKRIKFSRDNHILNLNSAKVSLRYPINFLNCLTICFTSKYASFNVPRKFISLIGQFSFGLSRKRCQSADLAVTLNNSKDLC